MSSERGMSLLEMLIAMLVFSIVLGGALSSFRAQSRGFSRGASEMTIIQNLRYAANMMETDLRTAGAGVPDVQPYLLYAGPDVVAYNANYTTNVANDVFAVYYDPDAPTGSVSALTVTQRDVILGTTFWYPDTSYTAGPIGNTVNSPAETITFYFAPDETTSRDNDYVLYRRVNLLAPEVVSRNLLKTAGKPFLQYYQVTSSVSGATAIVPVADDVLPLIHSLPIHLSPSDTGTAAVVDSVRAVRVNITATSGVVGAGEQLRTITRLIRLPNAGLASRRTCGDGPLLGTALSATSGWAGPGEPVVTLSWNPATDEVGGERDVVRYVIWRRSAASPEWGDPFLSIPSGSAQYTYVDGAVASGETLMYALAAQDCTPSLSKIVEAGPVAVP
jgi:prepilin-type N-terminal cleavage/methylation domain-containing protein